MKLPVALLLFCLPVIVCKAQVATDPNVIDIASVKEDSNVVSKTWMYIDSTSSLDAASVLQKAFIPMKERRRISPAAVSFTYFLKIAVTNRSDKVRWIYIYPGSYFSKIDLYKIHGGSIEPVNSGDMPGFMKLTLTSGETSDALFRLVPLKNEFNHMNPVLIEDDFINRYMQLVVEHKSDLQIFGMIISGVLFMMLLFMISNLFFAYKLEFLYNALYSFCMFLLIYFNSIVAKNPSPFTRFYYSYFDFFLLVAGTIFYIRFTRHFLDTHIKYERLDKFLRYGEQFILLLLVIYTGLHFFTNTYQPQFYLENIMKILILAIGVVFITMAFKQKDRLFNYIAMGNAMLVLFSLVSFALILLGVRGLGIFLSSIFYYNIGIVFEMFFFLLGLTYKNRSELIKSIKDQEALKLEAEKQEFETQLAVIKAQQEERNRISADMHDDLGAGMTTIRLYSELAKSRLAHDPIPEIEKISTSANELLNKMNAIIWSMNSSNDSLSNMIAYIRSYALEYFEDTGITCKIEIPEKLPNIEVIGEIRRNVFLVIKEALNNILKHAHATEVSIILNRVEDGLTLYIQDNGKGINLDALRQFGNGLKNMKKRMQDVGVEFSIENKNGTLITMHRKISTF